MKKILFSGIQPSGIITLGNYLGVIKKWIYYQNKYNCLLCINDLHSITNNNIFYSPKEYKKNIIFDTLSLIISSGINIEKTNIFLQSKINEHTYLLWILLCNININKLLKINKKIKKNMSMGQLNYVILMVSDILLYNSDFVMVSNDQIKNIELCKYIINKFNNKFNNIFKKPIFIINKNIIKSLTNPSIKMSKSSKNENSYISLLDDYLKIEKKIKLAITDSDNPSKINYDIKNKKGISNLIQIMSELNNTSIYNIENIMINKNYSYFKDLLSKNIYYNIKEIQYNYYNIRKNEKYLENILINNNYKMKKIAKINIKKIKDKIGIYE